MNEYTELVSTAQEEKTINLRKSASAILETLNGAHEIARSVVGEYPGEARKDIDQNGTIDELSVLLTDIKYSADRLLDSINKISQRI